MSQFQGNLKLVTSFGEGLSYFLQMKIQVIFQGEIKTKKLKYVGKFWIPSAFKSHVQFQTNMA